MSEFPVVAVKACSPWRAATAVWRRDFGELGEGGLEVFDDFGGDDVGIGEVDAIFEAFVFEPEDAAKKCKK
jgi:hypothetical protein